MDEAERCHKLAYIFKGKLMVHGTAEDVINGQHLGTWSISEGDLAALSRQLKGKPGVDQIIAFGSSLHVSGKNHDLLEQTLAEVRHEHHQVQPIPTTLEDIFIHLMQDNGENGSPS
jgi:ABC-2 type transport system ATP-binding protein